MIAHCFRGRNVSFHLACLLLGCAGMADLCSYLSAEVGVPVVDGVAAATKTVESLIALGLATSTRSEYAAPGPKQYVGALRGFTI